MKTTLLYAGMCCLLGIAGGCVAAPRGHAADSSTLTQVVRFADLDIQNAAGAEALYRRIRYAAQAVCPLPADLGHLVAQRACVNHAPPVVHNYFRFLIDRGRHFCRDDRP